MFDLPPVVYIAIGIAGFVCVWYFTQVKLTCQECGASTRPQKEKIAGVAYNYCRNCGNCLGKAA